MKRLHNTWKIMIGCYFTLWALVAGIIKVNVSAEEYENVLRVIFHQSGLLIALYWFIEFIKRTKKISYWLALFLVIMLIDVTDKWLYFWNIDITLNTYILITIATVTLLRIFKIPNIWWEWKSKAT